MHVRESNRVKHCYSADCGVFGGWPFLAYEYIKKEGGLQREEDYPYCCGLGGGKGIVQLYVLISGGQVTF